MSKKILFVLTSHDALGDSGGKTGTWLEELASAWYVLADKGHRLTLASVAGGAAPIDPASLEAPWLTDAGTRFLDDAAAAAALAATPRLGDLDPADFDAVYFVGGAGAAWDFPVDGAVRATIEAIDGKGGVVSAVCHGVLALAGASARNGGPLVAGRRVTAISNVEEEMTTFDTLVPVLPETRLVELGGIYAKAAEPFGAHVEADGNLVTGQNPASAPLVAEALLAAFAREAADAV
ncbi:type 1 glutamine amidotransferase domain-containing protein [Sphingomonas colocasiae]|uniref:Type 1 glutamine amidotransferase domain-containing protein n=1 Tax=Sphingomonas colocasiae TaxID=1848973 RepID=A0ABS7PXB5_9SPHN|nr:type 1 glutamine amidotransferase domain-containing protein [Sphingomonas colocasiae]MBY8824987.1 type 1 glutamine amidotransferase domain-containing protein [Sphingomonas colocasiae]